MEALVALLLLESLGLAWCCNIAPGDVNIARFGEASQSSTYTEYSLNPIARKAIDGVKNLDASYGGSCTHTQYDMGAWWRLDMKERNKVGIVVVYARSDGYLDRIYGLEVRIGDSPDNNNPVCGKIPIVNNVTTTFCCNGMEGQYVSLVIPGRIEFLTLCEVEIYDFAMYEVCQ